MDGMQCERRGDEGAPPQGTCHSKQDEEEQQAVCSVEQDVHSMVPIGANAEQLDVGHVRQPCHRMPIGRFHRREGMANSFNRKAHLNEVVLGNILPVINGHEFILNRLAVNREDEEAHHDENQGDSQTS